MTVFELPEGVEHGTPEGFAAGCRKDTACPALRTHGMACTYAHVRSQTDPRYFKAKVRDPRPAAIARALGITPDRARTDVQADRTNDATEPETRIHQAGVYGRHDPKTTATVAAALAGDPHPTSHRHHRKDAAQPLAESSQDRMPVIVPADAPSESPAQVELDDAGRREEMGHPLTTPEPEEPAVPNEPLPVPLTTDRWTNGLSVAGKTAKLREIREWARQHGHDVPVKGKIPQAALADYAASEDAGEMPTVDENLTAATAPRPKRPPRPKPEPEPVSDLIDQVRERIDMAPPAKTIVPDPGDHPDWGALQAEQAIARVEKELRARTAERNRAQTTGALLWDENVALQNRVEHLEQELATAYTALTLALEQWDRIKTRLDSFPGANEWKTTHAVVHFPSHFLVHRPQPRPTLLQRILGR